MNKSFLAHWVLVAIASVSLLGTGQAGISLWQAEKLNDFISNTAEYELVPEHLKAQFAQAYNEAESGETNAALERLTTVVTTNDAELEANAYYNRGNINLREARSMDKNDTGRIALIGLAKQDYRTALLINSELWDARYNLEIALIMVPEDSSENKKYTKRKGSQSVIVKVVGFRVDLP
ncbi:MAG: MxaK protein [Piscirickettsiaceae bacterium]|nr:MxaK protein [Piscirickettsiaceae bacterium]